uniref:Uncharacterized protein n=1 Tax=Heterorhabditis bacteriophora TaxID=37862 RepID=A0A1I7WSM2_HETBA
MLPLDERFNAAVEIIQKLPKDGAFDFVKATYIVFNIVFLCVYLQELDINAWLDGDCDSSIRTNLAKLGK